MRAFPLFFIAFLPLISGCGSNNSAKQAMALGSQVDLRCDLKKESLGITFKIGGDFGSMLLELTNKSNEELSVGSDVFLAFEKSDDRGALLAMGKDRNDSADRALMFASESSLFSGVEDARLVKYIYGPGGQAFRMDPSSTEDYKGRWSKALAAGASGQIEQQLMTWPNSESGWVATPALQPANAKSGSFRLIGKIGESGDKPIVVPLTVGSLEAFARDTKQPLVLREWAVGWLAALDGEEGWQAASTLLNDKQSPVEVRKAAARWLATQSSAKALEGVDKVLWDAASPEDLQLACYYALTWSSHPEAKPLIKKAGSHTNKKIKESANQAAPKE